MGRILRRRSRVALSTLEARAARVNPYSGEPICVPRTYIRCLDDRAVVPSLAAQCAARLGVTPVDMDCAHNAMLSRPDELRHALEHV
jgi:pimeloyl-ACP methyl ester carboxylesterase